MNNNNISCVSLVVSLSFQRQSHFRHILWKQHKAVWEARVFAESSWKLTCNSGGLTAAPTRAINPKFNTKTGSHTETVESPWRKHWQILVWIVKTAIIYRSSSSQSNSFDVMVSDWSTDLSRYSEANVFAQEEDIVDLHRSSHCCSLLLLYCTLCFLWWNTASRPLWPH